MRILGADLRAELPGREAARRVVVLLDEAGAAAAWKEAGSLAEAATRIAELAAGEPVLVGVPVPVVVPAKPSPGRPVEAAIRRRLGVRLAPGGRASLRPDRGGVGGEAVLTALAAAGVPALPWPDRDRRSSGLAEIDPGLAAKSLLWESSAWATSGDPVVREGLFRDLQPPEPSPRDPWTARAGTLDLLLRALGDPAGFDLGPARRELSSAGSEDDVERATALARALLLAGTARRYLESPETCAFVGDRESGYTILPADALVRRLALGEARRRPARAQLFPRASLRDRLTAVADLRSPDLLEVPGRPARLEAVFRDVPRYEFDNLDEMLWWKHCRHLAGPALPVEGLTEMAVAVGDEDGARPERLRLVRSRHRTLSFRFEPPGAWRRLVPPRDGRVYPLRILRATYDTLPVPESR